MFRIRPLPLILLLLLVVSGCAASGGGDGLPVPTEKLELRGVTNPSAQDYYGYGESMLEMNPGTAAEAFYWASRVDPTWAAPLVGWRLALFLSDPALFRRYLSSSRSALSRADVRQLDSLYLRALTLNPFLERGLEARALRIQWKDDIQRSIRRRNPTAFVDENAIVSAIEDILRDADDGTRAWVAHSEGRYFDAARYYERALEGTHRSAELHANLARVLFMLGRHPDAVEHMEAGLANLRAREDDELVRIYSSKALYLHSIGLIEETRGDPGAAREAYARALQEDLAYYPGHIRLAELALASGDTATALNEMRLAADIGPDHATVLLGYGRLLRTTGDLAGAQTAFQHLTEVEPWYPTGFQELARVLDARGQAAQAAAAYRAFVDRAPRNAPGVLEAEARLRELPAPAAPGEAEAGAAGGQS